jgi:hypothetical protein
MLKTVENRRKQCDTFSGGRFAMAQALIGFRLKNPENHQGTLQYLFDLTKYFPVEARFDALGCFWYALNNGGNVNALNKLGFSFAHVFLTLIETECQLEVFQRFSHLIDWNQTNLYGLRIVNVAIMCADLSNVFFRKAIRHVIRADPSAVHDLVCLEQPEPVHFLEFRAAVQKK